MVQNSKIPFAPPGDIDVTWSDTDMPWGGYLDHMTLRGGNRVQGVRGLFQDLVGTLDVGGVAQFHDSTGEWEVRNGTWPDMLHQEQDLKMQDIAWLVNGDWLAVSGRPTRDVSSPDEDRGVRGQLFHSDDEGATWTPVLHSFSGADYP